MQLPIMVEVSGEKTINASKLLYLKRHTEDTCWAVLEGADDKVYIPRPIGTVAARIGHEVSLNQIHSERRKADPLL